MVQFQISRGIESELPQIITDGKIYFCTDTGNLFIDYNTERIHINANKAKALIYYDEELEQYVDISANQLMELLQNNRPDLSQADPTAGDYVKGHTLDDAVALIVECGLVSSIVDENGAILTDENNDILI